jgi:hypothetical protein
MSHPPLTTTTQPRCVAENRMCQPSHERSIVRDGARRPCQAVRGRWCALEARSEKGTEQELACGLPTRTDAGLIRTRIFVMAITSVWTRLP